MTEDGADHVAAASCDLGVRVCVRGCRVQFHCGRIPPWPAQTSYSLGCCQYWMQINYGSKNKVKDCIVAMLPVGAPRQNERLPFAISG